MSQDEEQVRAVLNNLALAIRNKDADAAIEQFSPDAVVFDLDPPLSKEPSAAHDPALLKEWFDTWSSPIISELHDLNIAIGGDIAHAYGLQHMTGTKIDGEKIDLWFRATVCFRRKDNKWRITHSHNSVPFAMDGSGKALLDLKP